MNYFDDRTFENEQPHVVQKLAQSDGGRRRSHKSTMTGLRKTKMALM